MIFHLTSKRPVLIAGSGVRSAGAVDLLHEFADKTDIPVLTTMNAVDLAQDKDKFGYIGVYGNRIANTIVSEADLVVAVGARLGLRQVGNRVEYFAPKAKLIRADADQYELSRDIKGDEEKYLIDAYDFLVRLLDEDVPNYALWKEKCLKAKEILSVFDRETGNRCIEKISSLLPWDPVVAVDVGQNLCWSAQSLTLKGDKGRILIGGGYGAMGCALPYAIGASIARDSGTVFCITGDGGLQMNIQELQVLVREHLPIKIFVLNNRTLGKISEIQAVAYESRFAQTTVGSGYTIPDFVKIARAYGIKACTVEFPKLDQYLPWLLDQEPCLIDIPLPEDCRLIPKVNWNSKEIQPPLEEDAAAKIKVLFSQ